MLDLQAKSSFRITEDSKFFTKLLSKERTAAESSFRVCSSVPFMWESQPGTPKNAISHSSSLSLPPPLTPPPSYHRCYTLSHRGKTAGKSPRSNLFIAFLMRISLKRVKNVASPRFSPSVSSPSSPVFLGVERSHNSAPFDPDVDTEWSATALCFGITGSHGRN